MIDEECVYAGLEQNPFEYETGGLAVANNSENLQKILDAYGQVIA